MTRFVRIGTVIVNAEHVEALQHFSEGAVTVHLASGRNIAGIAQCSDEAFELMRRQLAGHGPRDVVKVRVMINGRERWVNDGYLSFEEICELAGVSESASVVWNADGVGACLFRGGSVHAEHGMRIDAVVTDCA